jgi:hypothetical protein
MPAYFASHFCENSDGSWTCTSDAVLTTALGRVEVKKGSRFYGGTIIMGFDLVQLLNNTLQDAERRAEST